MAIPDHPSVLPVCHCGVQYCQGFAPLPLVQEKTQTDKKLDRIIELLENIDKNIHSYFYE